MQQWLSSFITNVVTLSNDWKLKKYLDSPAMILQLVDIRTQQRTPNHRAHLHLPPSKIIPVSLATIPTNAELYHQKKSFQYQS